MKYREDFSDGRVEVIRARVTVRVDGEEIVRVVDTDALSPMGEVQVAVADERGLHLHEVHPVRWEVVKA